MAVEFCRASLLCGSRHRMFFPQTFCLARVLLHLQKSRTLASWVSCGMNEGRWLLVVSSVSRSDLQVVVLRRLMKIFLVRLHVCFNLFSRWTRWWHSFVSRHVYEVFKRWRAFDVLVKSVTLWIRAEGWALVFSAQWIEPTESMSWFSTLVASPGDELPASYADVSLCQCSTVTTDCQLLKVIKMITTLVLQESKEREMMDKIQDL